MTARSVFVCIALFNVRTVHFRLRVVYFELFFRVTGHVPRRESNLNLRLFKCPGRFVVKSLIARINLSILSV